MMVAYFNQKLNKIDLTGSVYIWLKDTDCNEPAIASELNDE